MSNATATTAGGAPEPLQIRRDHRTERPDQQQWLQHLLKAATPPTYVQAAMHNSQPGLPPPPRVVKHQLSAPIDRATDKAQEGRKPCTKVQAPPVQRLPQRSEDGTKSTVTRSALKEVTHLPDQAPPHLIANCKLLACSSKCSRTNPINVLLASYKRAGEAMT